ncbi:Type 1 glutamine amidotransferase-like domain-containing protein [Pseudonocardia sp. RS010]|uniref:Type 1 glutamine amidotransferase-like domain-containing protein n=1 Tax=Pseudonocardia sp. RS010 TaxID=3385979 RepID=UPI00399F625E
MSVSTVRSVRHVFAGSAPNRSRNGIQIDPHYLDPVPGSVHMGETREERIAEFLEENDVPVVGLREGGWLRVSGGAVTLHGSARVFRRGVEPQECRTGPLTP